MLENNQSRLNECLDPICLEQGQCYMNEKNEYRCKCESGNWTRASGSCVKRAGQCASNPCLNLAKCVDNYRNRTYTCICRQHFTGLNCQDHTQLCELENCSGNGYCIVDRQEYKAKCKCYYGYEGDDCSIMTAKYQLACQIRYWSVIVCFAFISLCLLLIIALDFIKLPPSNKAFRKRKLRFMGVHID